MTARIASYSPKAERLWEFAQANDIVVHIHPPMLSLGHESLIQYRLNEAAGRPFESTLNVARMIGSGVFDRHPKLQVLVVHVGGGLASILGRLDFNWHLNYDGMSNPPAGRPYTNLRKPSEYCKTNIFVDSMGFSSLGVRAAVEMCGVDRVVFGTDFGPSTASKSMCRSSRTCFPARLTATSCSGRQATVGHRLPPDPSRTGIKTHKEASPGGSPVRECRRCGELLPTRRALLQIDVFKRRGNIDREVPSRLTFAADALGCRSSPHPAHTLIPPFRRMNRSSGSESRLRALRDCFLNEVHQCKRKQRCPDDDVS
jgi:Amidohydrolase